MEAYVPTSAEGADIKAYVRQPRHLRRPVGYRMEFLEQYHPNHTAYLPEGLREQLHSLGRSPAEQTPAGTFARDILNRLLIDLSWASSQLEGNTYSRLDTARLIEFGQIAEGKDALEGIGYWAAGFEWALANFPQLEEAALSGVPDLLDSIWRHLPEQDETQQAMTKALDEEHPLKNLDEAIEALVFDVVDLAQIGLAESHKVETVIREHPKLGRNDPCHCGSGKRYKNCHGAH